MPGGGQQLSQRRSGLGRRPDQVADNWSAALTVLEYAIRQQLAAAQGSMADLYAGQPYRTTARPTAERVLEAFDNLTLTVVRLGAGHPPPHATIGAPAALAGPGGP